MSSRWGTPRRPNESDDGCFLLAVRTAARTVAVRVVLPVAALLATFGVVQAVLPHPTHRPATQSQIAIIEAVHDCAGLPGPGRTLLLIDSRPAGPRLVAVATSPDGAYAQRDLFYDERADFYGWCRP